MKASKDKLERKSHGGSIRLAILISGHPVKKVQFNELYYFTVVSFYRIRARERAKYASVLHCTIRVWLCFFFFFFLLKENEAKTKCSAIINLLFGVLVDNMRRHFTHCSHFSSPLQGSEKYYATRKISARIIYQNTE